MFFVDVKFYCMVFLYAYITESKVIVLRDYDDEPVFVNYENSEREARAYNQLFNPNFNFKQKRIKPKNAVIHYGRHIYHLDSFNDLSKLRSKLAKLNTDPISNGYVDLINDLIRSKHKQGKNVYILSKGPMSYECNKKNCEDDDYRKFSKVPSEQDLIWEKKKMPLGHNKRFQVVDNTKHRTLKKKKYISSEESREKKQKKYYSDSSSSESKETKESEDSREKDSSETKESDESKQRSSESYESKKKKYYESSSTSSEEIYTTRRPKKYKQSESNSDEYEQNNDSKSNSAEDYTKKKRKTFDHSDETKRKTFGNDDVILQGNKIYHTKRAFRPKKYVKSDIDRRRRLQHFLPKRYHWKASEIHDLGYYWFNGPKGRYPGPTPLSNKKK